MTDANANPPQLRHGVVKQVLSGDSIVLQGPPQPGSPPKEITVYLSNVVAPRLARRPNENGVSSPDEPYAWESREFVRRKIIGKPVVFIRDFIGSSGREHGRIYLGGTSIIDAENIGELAVAEGLLEVRPGKQQDEHTEKLLVVQERAKSAKKGKWSDDDPQTHVRAIQWSISDPRSYVEKYQQKRIPAVVDAVRDGSTIRLFLLPNHEHVTIMLSGVKAPAVRAGNDSTPQPFGEEARFFVEQRLLNRDVEVVLESTNNANFIGSVIHPKGNIAEFLLREGFAKCVDWSIGLATAGVATLREAERSAKDKKLRLWRNYTGGAANGSQRVIQGVVTEIGLGDSLTIEQDGGSDVKVYLSSLRAPKRPDTTEATSTGRKFSPLYDTPHMFEAREFLRRRLLGKRVSAQVDYIQPRQDNFPEKTCVTIVAGDQNVAVGLIERGLARVLRHRQDDENRSTAYDALLIAEANAEKEKKGIFGDAKDSVQRVHELNNDLARSKQFLSYFQRTQRVDGVVEFVSSGSRLRIYVPKESVVITFLLAGISCPRGQRIGPNGKPIGENEPFAEEALAFTRKNTLQRDVKIEVESLDKNGGFIGYLFVQRESGQLVNLSELLVENGLAKVHFTAERGGFFPQLSSAERAAKAAKRGLWQNYVESEAKEADVDQAADVSERKVTYKKVAISDIVPETFKFSAQNYEDASKIESLMKELQEIDPASEGTTRPKRNELAALRFNNLWHRVKVESVKADVAEVLYIDYGNRESVPVSRVAPLPARYQTARPLAHEYTLALVTVPNTDYAAECSTAFSDLVFSYPSLLINVEYKVGSLEAASLVTETEPKLDIAKTLLTDGYAVAEPRREHRLLPLVEAYGAAEKDARKNRRNIWKYGDFTGIEV